MQFLVVLVALAVSLLSGESVAHPGHDLNEEIAERAAFLATAEHTSLDHCAEQLQARSNEMIKRRKSMVEHLRAKRGLVKRDFDTVLNTDHHSNQSVTPDSPNDVIFGSNSSCILQPETTEGPYCMFDALRSPLGS